MRRLRATLFLCGLLATQAATSLELPAQYQSANHQFGIDSDTLTLFPPSGKTITIKLPFRLNDATFGPDGESIYGTIFDAKATLRPHPAGLSRIELNSQRATVIPGSIGILIKSFAVSSRQDKVVISGSRQDTNGRRCGVFDIPIPVGDVKQILSADCHNQWSWDHLSLSPNGEQAVATVGSNANHDLHLEILDLVYGTTKSLGGEFWIGAWSPDGKWIAARSNGRVDKLILIDAANFSRRRPLGPADVLMPQWSPDSRYLLLWKEYPFRCGFSLDVDTPATLETLDIQTGKRSTIKNSRCQIDQGTTGWISGEIVK
jgi:hypothetical protein